MELNVLNIKGEETGRKVTLDDAIFGIEPNDHAIYLDVKSHMANRRSGTAKTKDFAAILKSLKIEDNKDLFLLHEASEKVRKSGANISNVTFAEPVAVNTYKVLDADCLIFSESGLEALTAQLSREEK